MDHIASTNGYGYLTIEDAEAAATGEVTLPESGKKVRFYRISSSEYTALLPVPPAAADDWPKIEGEGEPLEALKKARRTAEQDWVRGLPVREQVRLQQERQDVMYRTIAYALVRPQFTERQARLLGNDADWLFLEIMKASKLWIPREAPPVEAGSPPSPATAAAA